MSQNRAAVQTARLMLLAATRQSVALLLAASGERSTQVKSQKQCPAFDVIAPPSNPRAGS